MRVYRSSSGRLFATHFVLFTIALLFSVILSCKDEENLPPLKITAIDPAVAYIGDTIRIKGQGFSPGYNYNSVTFTGGAGTRSVPGSTTEELLVEVPDGAGSGEMTVSILDVETAVTPTIEIKVPVVNEVLPLEAWIGDTITIQGENFQLNKFRNHVRVGTSDYAEVTAASRTALRVVVPRDATDGPVTVMGISGSTFKVKPSAVDAIAPTRGVVGDTIEIQGNGMNVASVTFTPRSLTGLVLQDKTSRRAYVVIPAGATDGTLSVQNNINNTTITLETTQALAVYPSIRNISPLSGNAGMPVTIEGYNFSVTPEENNVKFNGVAATVTSAQFNRLEVSVPASFTTGPVTVTVNGREAIGPAFSVAEPGAPIIYSISPQSGPRGSRVVINGINFSSTAAANTVRFTGNATANVVSASATQLVVEVPATAQSGQIQVIKDGKTGIAPNFTITSATLPFIASIEPASAPRGATITLKGGNFKTAGVALADVSGAAVFEITSVTADQIVARVPANVNVGDRQLQVSQGGIFSNTALFEVSGTPVVTALSLPEATPGTILTITGNDFNPNESKNTVRFGTQNAQLVNANDQNSNTIAVYVPDIASGIYDVSVTAFGTTSNSTAFKILTKQVAVRNIIFTTNAPPNFSIKKRTSDPPSESTIFSGTSVRPENVLTLDLLKQQAYFVKDEGNTIARINFDQSNQQTVYSTSTIGGGTVIDMSLDLDHQKIFLTDNIGSLLVANMDGSGTPEILFDYTNDIVVPLGVSYVSGDNSLYIVSYYPDLAPLQLLRGSTDGNQLVELFNGDDGLTNPFDVKVDYTAQKLFVLDNLNTIKVGNLDGSGSLVNLVTRSRDILGVALDMKDQFIYWMEFSNAGKTQASVFRMKYDKSDIPGTDPPSSVQEVYTNISQFEIPTDPLSGGMTAGLTLEDETGAGASSRSARSFSPMKFSAMRRGFSQFQGKMARPGK